MNAATDPDPLVVGRIDKAAAHLPPGLPFVRLARRAERRLAT